MDKIATACVVLLLVLGGCDEDDTKSDGPAEKATKTKTKLTGPAEPPDRSREDELRRLVHAPGHADRDLMLRLLSEDGAARRWSSLSLGLSCTRENATDTVRRLSAAAATWLSESGPPSADQLHTLSWAIGACAATESEEILRAWLNPDPTIGETGLTEAGVFGLGALADRVGRLSERTQTALLDTAQRDKRADFLQPLSRIGSLNDAVGAHILEVTGQLLTKTERDGSRHAIFALGSAGPSATGPLSQVLIGGSYEPRERAAAAQALARLGDAGQRSLDETLRDVLKRGLPLEFDNPTWVPLRAIINNLKDADASRGQLAKLSSVTLPEGKERPTVAQRRRLVWLRCQAARLLAEDRYEYAPLLKCDPEQGREFSLAQVEVLGKRKIKGRRAQKYAQILKSSDPVVAQAALRLLADHSEVAGSAKILHDALLSDSAGTQATAAQIISAYPARAHVDDDAEGPSKEIIEAITGLLDPKKPVATETRAAAINAAGALGALSLKPAIEKLCNDSDQAMWGPAQGALRLLGAPRARCPKQAAELVQHEGGFSGKATLIVESDVGQLKLHVDGADAPISTAHFLKKVDAGFYDGLAVHGSRAGFAVQFGDEDGDGYQDGPSTSLPHEVSPRPFEALTFGMSAFSPGSHDTQIFVVVSDAPQLHASRVHLGKAEGPWHLLVVGDQLHSIRRE